ncbi:MAG: hypothetical protein LBN27_06760 [Prevotellaceae bacterium]|jgi:hypothetical protein|nr:hypothetical protein [Prevotellaceae bacterium]
MGTLTLEKPDVLTYSQIAAMMRQQDRLIAAGRMERPKYSDDIFTPEQEEGFRRGITIDDIFNRFILR